MTSLFSKFGQKKSPRALVQSFAVSLVSPLLIHTVFYSFMQGTNNIINGKLKYPRPSVACRRPSDLCSDEKDVTLCSSFKTSGKTRKNPSSCFSYMCLKEKTKCTEYISGIDLLIKRSQWSRLLLCSSSGGQSLAASACITGLFRVVRAACVLYILNPTTLPGFFFPLKLEEAL